MYTVVLRYQWVKNISIVLSEQRPCLDWIVNSLLFNSLFLDQIENYINNFKANGMFHEQSCFLQDFISYLKHFKTFNFGTFLV